MTGPPKRRGPTQRTRGRKRPRRRSLPALRGRIRRALMLLLLGAALAYPGAFVADALLAALQ
jgi:anti-sigma factor RsiW